MKYVLNLSGKWNLSYSDFNKNIFTNIGYANVPGNVHLDLIKSGIIPNPYYSDNFKKCRWIENKDWQYTKKFFIPDKLKKYKTVKLIFYGIDTISEIWLNNKFLGKTDNMFIPVVFNIKNIVKYNELNKLIVKISSAVQEIRHSKYKNLVKQTWLNNERIYLRKSQYNFGWDIAPRLVSVGIWKPVEIIGYDDVYIENVYIKTESINETEAKLKFNINLQNTTFKPKYIVFNLKIKHKNKKIFYITQKYLLEKHKNEIEKTLIIKKPHLWWPNGIGKPDLYTAEIIVKSGKNVLDTYKNTFGIRKIELKQEYQDDGGISFYFKINDKKIFIKGVNWTPLDAIPANINKIKYDKIIKLIKKQNVNCIRVWGGGYYETDHFYELCDKNGILIWQDFMFACGIYPQDKKFLNNIKTEADYIIKHLRNHPCLLIWCGDNEVDQYYYMANKEYRKNKINRKILKNLCNKLTPEVPYIPSSPFSTKNKNPLYTKQCDNHLWYHGLSYKDDIYSKDDSRFISEIGHLSIPNKDTIKKFIPKKYLWPPDNKIWDQHFGTHFLLNFHPERRKKLDLSIKIRFGYLPDKLDEYIKLSQKLQAEALKYWILHCWNSKYCGGIIYWNIIDCWPQFSDSVIDYYMKPKQAYYIIKRIYKKLTDSNTIFLNKFS